MNREKLENEKILAAAVRYLLQGDNKVAASLLMRSEIERHYYDEYEDAWVVELRGTRQLYDVIEREPRNPLGKEVSSAIFASLPVYAGGNTGIVINVRMALVEVDLDWRAKLLAEVETGVALNQNVYQKQPFVWRNIRFSSEPEVKIAEALERAGIMYIPNCLVRAGSPEEMVSRFPDFLICFDGKWGILEVDGQKYHQGRATEDHERSRIIERHGGIAYLTRFDYRRCMDDPDGVIKDFIEVLQRK